MMTNTKLFLFNLDDLSNDSLQVIHTRLVGKGSERMHHSYLNLDNRTVVVS